MYIRIMKRVLAGAIIGLFVGCFLMFAPAGADLPPSHWAGGITINELSTVSDRDVQYPAYCTFAQASVSRIVDHGGSISQILGDTEQENLGEKCIVSNAQGSFALEHHSDWNVERNEAAVYKPGGSGSFLKWESGMGTKKWYDPAPMGSSVLYLYRRYSSDSAYQIKVTKNLRDTGQAKIGKDYMVWGAKSDDTVRLEQYLEYNNRQRVTATRHGFSPNGRYLLLYGGEGLFKVDLADYSRTMILGRQQGQMLYFAISSDGNYAAALDDHREVHIYDLRSCEMDQSPGLWQKQIGSIVSVYTGCKEAANLKQQMTDQQILSYNSKIRRLHFSPSGQKLYFSITVDTDPNNAVYDDVIWKEFEVQADDWKPTAEGYLALGDSYTSGEGDTEGGTWYEPGTDEQGDKSTFAGRNLCHLSRRSYPYLIGLELGYLGSNLATPPADGLFHSVACSGAKIHNVIGIIGENQDDGSEVDFAVHG